MTSGSSQTTKTTQSAEQEETLLHDPHLWLEEVEGEAALAWVDEQNARTLARFADTAYEGLVTSIRDALDSEDRIPGVSKLGEHYYNFWRDRAHPKGLWRRTSWESYVTESPDWEILLDVDALAAAEETEWVFQGARVRRSDSRRALVFLSPDGGDAHMVREFDLEAKAFVADMPDTGGDEAGASDAPFVLPTAKAQASWVDDDTLLVATDWGPGTLTDSTYPASARLLRRGQGLHEAAEIRTVPAASLAVFAGTDRTPGYERAVVTEALDFYNSRTWIRALPLEGDPAAGWTLIDVPTDVSVDVDRDLLLFRPRTDWTGTDPDGEEFTVPAGALAVAPYEEFVHGAAEGRSGARPRIVFAPEAVAQPAASLQGWSFTRNHLVLAFLRDVRSELRVIGRSALRQVPEAHSAAAEAGEPAPGELPGVPVPGVDPMLSVGMGAVDPDDEECGDDVWMTVSGFLTPTTLLRGTLGTTASGGEPPAVVKTAPQLFDASGLTVTQHFAVSADGTRVPYFQVGPASAQDPASAAEPAPVMLDGYGGFELSRLPGYAPTIGLGWLERGGTYVLANIRGGGEYGPGWHAAALRENRHRAYEDFVAVARDLVARGVTVPERLACSGGSNGGLLVGNMLTQFPEDFGAVSCGVPLLDMRRYTRLSAGASWAAEYGDPEDPEQWEFIRTFSPYHLIDPAADHPPVLFWTATSDDRVGPVQARKMAARMQEAGIEDVWFYEDRDGGHSAASDNEQAARTRALSYRFLMEQLTAR
ncbi:prolyl oligopeptidase family serine peptidase [Brevibacterium album]|uniref:prolyl oligopeptidase family serine peptidase n=1 Tax=Brevibacterium album TaxID=417948 RepID=UPI0003FABB7C|nr:prolyl oligopeptidase family serine peptidase [Brevibacterium album]